MHNQLVTILLPTLTQPWREPFNIFNVMHHGTHEKQLSNIFTWLLDPGGSHNLGDRFLRIFLDEVNRHLDDRIPVEAFAVEAFAVEQERNTAEDGEQKDVSDIVFVGDDAVVVIENYYKSDGHLHSYQTYLNYAQRRGNDPKYAVVVMLCGYVDDAALAEERNKDWIKAPVVTYPRLLSALSDELASDEIYKIHNAKSYWFIDQLVSYFVKGTPVNEDLFGFISGMCDAGEAARYRNGSKSDAERFATDFSKLAKERFTESRKLLQRGKATLKTYCLEVLKAQVNKALGDEHITDVSANYSGIYQWTINFLPVEPALEDNNTGDGSPGGSQPKDGGPGRLQLKFGPSAWFANETNEGHKFFPKNVPPSEADYTRLFMTWNREIRQSAVSMQEILDGLPEEDTRLLDEILALIRQS